MAAAKMTKTFRPGERRFTKWFTSTGTPVWAMVNKRRDLALNCGQAWVMFEPKDRSSLYPADPSSLRPARKGEGRERKWLIPGNRAVPLSAFTDVGSR